MPDRTAVSALERPPRGAPAVEQARVLVVDDDAETRELLRVALTGGGYSVAEAASAGEALERCAACRPDAVLLDISLPDLSGLDAFHRIREIEPNCAVVFITGNSSAENTIEAMKIGAIEYLVKPIDVERLHDAVAQAVAASRSHAQAVAPAVEPSDSAPHGFVGRSSAMQAVYKAIGRVASQDVTVLVLGESGTGKELAARAIHKHSRRAARPLLAINCAAIPESLLESELFGHERGAFTGASTRRIGKFEQCAGGTLFLDEIGDMTPATQAKVLRVLQDQRFERVGGNETVAADVRVIAATNHDLAAMVSAGKFRADLYYRLRVFTISMPALRDRPDDLRDLIDHHLRSCARELGKNIGGPDSEALALLVGHSWPGNVRELQGVLKQAVLLADGHELTAGNLSVLIRPGAAGGAAAPDPMVGLDQLIDRRLADGTDNLHAEVRAVFERRLFCRVLQHAGGNLSLAAKTLGINRGTLKMRLDALGIALERPVAFREPDTR